MKIGKTTAALLLSALLMITSAYAQSTSPEKKADLKNAFCVNPIMMIIASSEFNIAVVSFGYERLLTHRGLALYVPFHVGYLEETHETRYALGTGLGLRKYLGRSFEGTYVTGQSDYLQFVDKGERQSYTGTPTIDPPPYTSFSTSQFYSISQLSFGFKKNWGMVSLDMSLGGAFYATREDKRTQFIGAVNVGFPFNQETFGF